MDSGSQKTRLPGLAIGLPVRNGANYLERALECLRGQTYEDWRLLISDNCSTDSTEAVGRAASGGDPRIEYRRQGENLGASGNFNYVFHEAGRTGGAHPRYFKWMAHDDLFEPRFLEACVARLEAEPDAVIAHTYTREIDGEGRVIGRYDDQSMLLVERASDRLRASFALGYPSPVWGVMRREAVGRTRLMGPYLGSDWNFLGEMVLLGRVALVPEYLFSVRNHETGFSFGLQKTSKRNRLQWFDPRAKGPTIGSALASARHFASAALRHPLPMGERARCLAHIAGRFTNKAWHRLGMGARRHGTIEGVPGQGLPGAGASTGATP